LKGNVGIGTTAPNSKLTISNEGVGGTDLLKLSLNKGAIPALTVNGSGQILYGPSVGYMGVSAINFGNNSTYNSGANDTFFLINPSNSNSSKVFGVRKGTTDYLTIDGSGNVGIGTTNPTRKLDVIGDGSFSTNLNVGGTGYFSSLIGIGTTAPTERLEIVGNAKISGNLYAQKLFDFDNSLYSLDLANAGSTASSMSLTSSGSIRFNYNDNGTHIINSSAAKIQNYTNGLLLGVSSSTSGTVTGWDSNLFLATSGNVGIGTTNPTHKLDVVGDAYFSTNLSVRGTAFFASNIGIGTTNPLSKLDIAGTQQSSESSIKTSNTNNAISINYARGANGGYEPGLMWYATDNVSGTPKAGMWMQDTNFGSNLFLGTSNDYVSGLTNSALTVNYSGNVGIGTTNPTRKLEIYNSTAGDNEILLMHGAENGLLLQDLASADMASFLGYNGTSYNAIEFRAKSGYGSQLVLATSGNVGIGTANPLSKLSVVGSISADNIVLAGNNQLSGVSGFSNYLNFSGGLGTGGVQRLTANGNLTNINNIQAGSLNIGVGGSFATKVDYPTGTTPYSVAIGDLNGDGKADLAVTNYNSTSVSVLINQTTTALFTSTSGKVGIGTTNPSYPLQVYSRTYYGYVTATGTWGSSSDARLKTNITTLSDSLNKISSLRPVTYKQIGNEQSGEHLGFIAQEVEPILPELVGTDINGYKSIDYASFAPILVGAIQEQQSEINELKSNINITTTGQIAVSYNISDEVLASLGYDGAKNEIENATYKLTDSTGAIVTRISQFGEIAAAKIKTGLISATNVVTKNLISEKTMTRELISPKANIDQLTAVDIQTTSITTDELISRRSTIDDLQSETATISTLYADNIISKEGSIGDLMALKVSAVRDELKKLIDDRTSTTDDQTAITGTSIASQTSDWKMNIASDSAQITGDLAITNNLIIGAKLLVNGDTQLANAFITGTFSAGEISIKDNFIETTNTALYIQPSNTGSIHMMGDTLVIAENGEVQINGNLAVSGSLFANLITAGEIQTQKLTATEINSDQVKIATDSAQVIIADSGFAALATSSANLTSNATAGTATLPAGKTELIINNNKITANSMVYITPVGSTKNQVLYIKEKVVSESESYFTIALDNALDQSIDINWWIIN